ncbi:hypothetical protein KGF54_003076 [Candida jiufengensis]|uniref:uncharacterized protein n=1 Tax=Candida jiufengensis TaxID=497108 RepID=UPI0022251AE1|nr:uncharacterized protein KGF54_003076 [Candida jiufengensis]KAI5953704.1 hypothetical protein KGF54_003076 [Candida jiufengensis]
MENLASITAWSPTTTATSTTLSSVPLTAASALQSSLLQAVHTLTSKGSTINNEDYISASRIIRGAQASLSIISAEQVIATATDDATKSRATQLIWQSTENLLNLVREENVYDIDRLNRPANIIFLVLFAITFLYCILIVYKSRYWWFNIAFVCGTALEFLGYLGRVLSFGDMSDFNFYLLQLIALTIAPAFLMGGIYYVFALLCVIMGRKFSLLKPLVYSYVFIACDVISLVIQAVGGGIAAVAAQNYESAHAGEAIMVTGIAFQVFSMSIYLILWFIFLWNIFFKVDILDSQQKWKPSIKNFLRLFFNTSEAQKYKETQLEHNYNPKFKSIRNRPLFNYYPLAITIAVATIYIRCIYRVVELAQGFRGYLITHEVYVMVLDATMCFITCLIFMPFHPQIVLGSNNLIRLKTITKNEDEKHQLGGSALNDEEKAFDKDSNDETFSNTPVQSNEQKIDKNKELL